MSDTAPDVEARLLALMIGRSGSERVRMACEMFDMVRALAMANLRRPTPGGPTKNCARLLDRLYATDLDRSGALGSAPDWRPIVVPSWRSIANDLRRRQFNPVAAILGYTCCATTHARTDDC